MAENTLNLEQVVEDWAWRRFEMRATKSEKKLLKKQRTSSDSASDGPYIKLQIDWSSVQFVDHTTWRQISDAEVKDTQAAKVAPQGQVASALGGRNTVACPSAPQVSILFQTKFTNNTEDPQEYTMRTEKTTRSTCCTEIESCFTKGFEMGVTLKSPGEIFEANAGFKREFSLSSMHGQTFEEELNWGVESQIKVKAGHEAEASLVVNEKKQNGDFAIETQIWGKVYARFINIDNSKHMLTSGEDIADIVEEYLKKQRRIRKGQGQALSFVQVRDGVEAKEGEEKEEKDGAKKRRVFVETRGRCNFRYGVKQEIKVNQIKIG